MITPERIAEIDAMMHTKHNHLAHSDNCILFGPGTECDCAYGMARELLSELKDSLSREKKKREEVSRFASKLTEWIEDQIA